MIDLDFSGKNILVVGGSSGIGNAAAQMFRARGANVYVWGTRETAEAYKDEEGSDLTGLSYHCVNVADRNQIKEFNPPFSSLDCLVLCQGVVKYKQAEFEEEGWDSVVEVNLNSVMNCSRRFRAMLQAASGSIVVVSSVAAYRATIGNPAYGASKAGAAHLVRNLGEAWIRDGIRVNGVAPGMVATKMTRVTTQNEARSEKVLAGVPIRRFGEPEEIAGAILFLASPLSSYTVGHTIVVDGGMILS